MSINYTGLQKAVQRAGGVEPLANFLKVTHTTVSNWLSADGVTVVQRAVNPSLSRVIEAAGSQAALARELGVTNQVIGNWIKQGYVPSGRAQQIENTYGVPRAELVSPKLRSAMGIGGEL